MILKPLLTGSFIFALSIANAQFGGINKIKDKAKDAVPSSSSSDSKTAKDAAGSMDKSDPQNSPAKESIYKLRSELTSVENAVNKNHNNLEEDFKKIEDLLAKVKSEDPGWPDYAKEETRYKDMKSKYETKNASRKSFSQLFDMTNDADHVKNHSIYDLLSASTAKNLSKASLDEVKAYYDAHPEQANENVKNNIAFMEKFHAEKMPKLKKEVLDFIDNDYTKKTTRYQKANRAKADYIKKLGYGGYPHPESDIETISHGLKYSDQAVILFSGDAEITAQNKALKDAKADLETYAKSDELKKHNELRKKQDFEDILLQKPRMNDASVDAIVKRDYKTSEWGTIKRISLTSTGWQIQKNGAGIPLRKYIDVETCSGKDGKCWRVSGTVVSEYTGGGTYAKPTYASQSANEMNCNNVNKNLEDIDKY